MGIMHKKGAIEMSMQTIIIVVIGVTLLVLGLNFVRGIMGKEGIGGMGGKMRDLSDKQMGELFGESEDPIYINVESVTIEQGDSETIDVVIRNVGGYGDGEFSYAAIVQKTPSEEESYKETVKKWFTYGEEVFLKDGKGASDKFLIEPPSNARTGTYMIKLELACPNEPKCSFTQFILKVKGG